MSNTVQAVLTKANSADGIFVGVCVFGIVICLYMTKAYGFNMDDSIQRNLNEALVNQELFSFLHLIHQKHGSGVMQ